MWVSVRTLYGQQRTKTNHAFTSEEAGEESCRKQFADRKKSTACRSHNSYQAGIASHAAKDKRIGVRRAI